ncbi:MAG TPA: ComEC/Rec2 family competence protein [Bacteroidales bacterium]
MFWSGKPFVRIFFLFLSGVLLVVNMPILQQASAALLLSITFSFLLISLYFTVYVTKHRYSFLNGLSSGFLVISIAITLTSLHYSLLEEPVSPDKSFYLAQIIKEPSESEKTVKLLMRLESFQDFDGVKKTDARVMVFIEKDSLSQMLSYGDEVMFSTVFKVPSKPMNPQEFDYAQFLELNVIRYVAFVPSGQWSLVKERKGFSIFAFAAKVRHILLDELQRNGLSGDEFAVAAAILLGYDNLMDQDLEQHYRTAGAMHILVVSGLHVGIIYLVLNFLLGFLRRNQKQKIIRMVILLLIVWFYAILTGLAPSVQRSAVMISMFIFADATNRFKNNYNTLAASAVLLMLFNPLIIYSVGFQLSYAAVFGILFFYRPIFRLVSIKNKFLRIIWEILVVSFSAQLGTFPIAAHYFHFFPTYFLLTNIIVFPLSFLILSSGLLFVSVFWIPFVSQIVGFVLYYLVFVLNFLIAQVKYFPFSGLSGLYFPWLKVAFVYMVIFSLFYWLVLRNRRFILSFFAAFFLLISFGAFQKYQNMNQKSLLVYHINKHTAIDFIKGEEHVFLADSALVADTGMIEFHLVNFQVAKNLDSETGFLSTEIQKPELGLQVVQNIADFNGYRILILDKNSEFIPGDFDKPKLDAVLITGKKKVNLEDLQLCFNFERIIMDASVPSWKRKQIKAESERLGLQVYDTNDNGAFIIDL